MALNYTFSRYKDVYTLLNNDTLSNLNYTVYLKNCDTSKKVGGGVVKPGESKEIKFIIDGTYSVVVNDEVLSETIPDIFYYEKLLSNIIKKSEQIFCGCKPCDDCEDCNSCDAYLDLFTYVNTYSILHSPLYNDYIVNIQNELKCRFNEGVVCAMNQSFIRGKVDVKELVLLNIASYFIAFYFVDLYSALDEEEAEYIKEKYKTLKILKCIKKLGINIDDFNEQLFSNVNVYYWQLDNVIEDINNVIPLITNIYLSSKNNVPFEVFREGKVVNYSSIGRIVFAIKEVISQNFIIEDSLGNNVTDDFDVEYIAPLQCAIYVSKSIYTHSNIFFKFKAIGVLGNINSPVNPIVERIFNSTFNNTFN